jgi:hypothetical protein
MRATLTILQLALWAAGAWLFIGLLGTLRWLSSGADPGPEAMFAISLRFALVIGIVTAFYVYETFRNRPEDPDGTEALA